MRSFAVPALIALLSAQPVSAQGSRTLPAHMARMFPVSTRAAWEHLSALLAEHKMRPKIENGENQFLILRDIPIDRAHFGFGASRLAPDWDHGYVDVHIFIPRAVEPARVYVESKVDGFFREVNGVKIGAPVRTYSPEPIAQWFYERLEERIGSPGFPIPEGFEERAALAQSLPPGQRTSCLARLLSGDLKPASSSPPAALHVERFDLRRGAPSSVTVDASVFEDGFVWPRGIIGKTSGEFGIAAITALMMSPHTPSVFEGCPVPVSSTFVVKASQ
jgi:hypothetical protein